MVKARYVALVEGKVQKGSFRSFIKKHALMYGITGYAENLEGGEVLCIFEGEKDSIDKLLKLIEKEAPAYIKVEGINKREERYTGSFNDFERKGIDIIPELEEKSTKEILFSMASTLKSTDEKLEVGVAKLGEISNKQDKIISILKSVKEDTVAIKQDTAAIKRDTAAIKQDTAAIKQNIALLPSIKEDTSAIKKNTGSIPECSQEYLMSLTE
jgi:acylphosphatase